MNLNQTLQKWISLDSKMKEMNEELKMIRNEKNNLEAILNKYAKDNEMENKVINVNDNKIKFAVTKTSEPITFKYLEKNLGNIIKNENQLEKTMEYLKENREIKYNYSIKQMQK